MQNGKLRAIILLTVLFMLLGSTLASAEETEQQPEDTPIELNVWQLDFLDYLPAFQAYVDQADLNISINVYSISFTDYMNGIVSSLTSDEVPDILMVPSWFLPDMINGARDNLADMTEIDADAVAGMKQSLANGVWDSVNPPASNQVQLIPVSTYPKALFYRTDLFKKAGLPADPTKAAALLKDWDAVAKSGKTFIAKTKKPLFGQWVDLFNEMVANYPIKYGTSGKFAGALNPQFKKTFDFVIRGMKEGWIGKTKIRPVQTSYDKAAKAGSFGTVIGGVDTADRIKQKEYGGGSGQWAAIPIPGGIADSGSVSFAIPAKSANPELALDVIAWLTNPEMQQWAFESPMAAFPANLEMLSGGDWLNAKDPFFGGQNINKVLADAVISAKPDTQMWAVQSTLADAIFLNQIQSYANNPKQDPSKLWKSALKDAESSR